MKQKSEERTLLASAILSSPGPIVVGIGLLLGRSSTQLADFIRRTAELAAILMLGVTTNSWFWLRYRKLNRTNPNAILTAQSKLYRAKSLIDACVTIALAAVAVAPASAVARSMDVIGSAVVALYLIASGAMTAGEWLRPGRRTPETR